MKAKTSPYVVFLHVALVALCGLTVVLGAENTKLNHQLQPMPNGPAIGETVDEIRWQTLDGDVTMIDFTATKRDSLLMIFTTDCPACRENQGRWRAVHHALGERINMLGISLSDLDATRAYRETHAMAFPVGIPVDSSTFAQSLAVSGVPLTVRVGPDGRVKGIWQGVLSQSQVATITGTERG